MWPCRLELRSRGGKRLKKLDGGPGVSFGISESSPVVSNGLISLDLDGEVHLIDVCYAVFYPAKMG